MNLTANKVTLEVGDNADDYLQADVQERAERKVSANLWTAILESLDKPFRDKIAPKVAYPLKNMTKAEIIKTLPPDLLDLCWSCRDPVRNDDAILPCGICHACKQREK